MMNENNLVLPNLFIAGAGKSGTTSLHEYLNQHPDIYMSEDKEPHFFSDPNIFSKGITYYSNLFKEGEGCKIIGESSTSYMTFPNSTKNIKQYISSPKFIFLLRNPIDRVYSHYWWLRGLGIETKNFKEAFLFDADIEPSADNGQFGPYRYYAQYSLYYKWLKKFYNEFGAENIHIITTEQLQKNTLTTLNSCAQFLNVSDFKEIKPVESNPTVILKNPRLYVFLWKMYSTTTFQNIKLLLKKVLPIKIFNIIIIKISLNSFLEKNKHNEKYPKISNEDRLFLAKYYMKEVTLLRNLTGLQFTEWEKDFPIK